MDQWREFRINKSQRGRLSNTWNWFAAAMPCSTSSTICIVSLYFVAVSMINGLHQSVSVSSWVVGLAWFLTLIILVLTILIITGLNLNYCLYNITSFANPKSFRTWWTAFYISSCLIFMIFHKHHCCWNHETSSQWIQQRDSHRRSTCLQIKI